MFIRLIQWMPGIVRIP